MAKHHRAAQNLTSQKAVKLVQWVNIVLHVFNQEIGNYNHFVCTYVISKRKVIIVYQAKLLLSNT